MYLIRIESGNMSVSVTASWDTQFFVFNAGGLGVCFNDDFSGLQSGWAAGAASGFIGGAGEYYVAISGYDHDPDSVGGPIFPDTPFSGVNGPTGTGGGSPVSAWSGTGTASSAGYVINLTDCSYTVPEPGTIFAVLAGLGILAARRRK
jgi:hypothetical protein